MGVRSLVPEVGWPRGMDSVPHCDSLAQANGPDSQITDASGETFTVAHALRMGYIQPSPNGQGYVATAEYAELFPAAGDAKQDAAPASDDQTTPDTNEDAAKDDQLASDFTVSEESAAIIEAVVSKVVDSPVLYAIEKSLVEGNMDSATKLTKELARTVGIDEAQMQQQIAVVMSDRINQARSFVTAEIGLDAAELDAYEAHLASDPEALRSVREAIAAGDKATVVRAAQQYASDVLFSDTEIDATQDLRVDGRSVAPRGRWTS